MRSEEEVQEAVESLGRAYDSAVDNDNHINAMSCKHQRRILNWVLEGGE